MRLMKGKNIKDLLTVIIPRPGLLAWSLFAVQAVYLVLFMRSGLEGFSFSFIDLAGILFSFITLLLLASSLEILFFHRISAYVVIITAIIAAWAMNAYRLTSGSPLDYSLVRDNLSISFSPESFLMISTAFSARDLIILPVIAAMLYLAVRVFPAAGKSLKRNTVPARLTSLVAWIILVLLPINAGDGFTLFAKSALDYNNSPAVSAIPAGYPYFKKKIQHTSFRENIPRHLTSKPNIFLILIESFNANFVEADSPGGITYTPQFNALIKKGLYLDRFYANSVQTCKGQESIFFSIIPTYKGKLFVDYPELNISGFPAILTASGYETIFFQAYHDLKFDNTYNSMIKAGFTTVKSYSEYRKPADRPYIWGWGVEDKIFYERFFTMLDQMHESSPEKPVFASLMTVGTHIPCDGMPPEKMSIYKNPREIKEKYSNALHLSDSQLPRFFELMAERPYLANSIIIITADHSFPMKEHGIYNNEKCFYDETFRVPFLVIWDGVVKPGRISNRAYSQIDIGPTIMDMAGIVNYENTMTGTSIFDRNSSNPVFLVQPYNGRYLQVVDYPHKYIMHIQTQKEYLFNLEADPAEKNNLARESESGEKILYMKNILERVHFNQKLIDENRIRPAAAQH